MDEIQFEFNFITTTASAHLKQTIPWINSIALAFQSGIGGGMVKGSLGMDRRLVISGAYQVHTMVDR